ncbi:MAG: AP2 domain-containing protein [Nitrospira sp.]|nr:AP2 domain-containing protein [Nitrospira sp.]
MISGVEPVAIMHIYRIDSATSRTHAWFVTVQRRGRIYHQHFADFVYGGKRKALDAAKLYRDSLVVNLRPLTRLEVCQIKKKNNRSGVSGVTRIDATEQSRGRSHRRQYWLAQWPIGNGKAKKKKFSITRYGDHGARQRAVRARQEALKSLART